MKFLKNKNIIMTKKHIKNRLMRLFTVSIAALLLVSFVSYLPFNGSTILDIINNTSNTANTVNAAVEAERLAALAENFMAMVLPEKYQFDKVVDLLWSYQQDRESSSSPETTELLAAIDSIEAEKAYLQKDDQADIYKLYDSHSKSIDAGLLNRQINSKTSVNKSEICRS